MADQDYAQYGDCNDGEYGYEYADEDNNGDAMSDGATDLSMGGKGGSRLGSRETDDDKKLFIGGLGWGTTQDDLQSHFSKYGGIVQVTIKTNPTTGRSRGFAFVQFNNKDSVERVLVSGPHLINGTQVDPKRVKARRSGYNKVFIGGLDPDLPESEIRAYFERYGKIEGIELPYDKIRNQRKQFCFVAFESEDVVDQICKQPKQRIGGRECDVKKATRRQGGGRVNASSWAAGYTYDYGMSGRRRGRGGARGFGNRDFGGGQQGGGRFDNYGSYGYNQNYGQSYGSGGIYGNYGGYNK